MLLKAFIGAALLLVLGGVYMNSFSPCVMVVSGVFWVS